MRKESNVFPDLVVLHQTEKIQITQKLAEIEMLLKKVGVISWTVNVEETVKHLLKYIMLAYNISDYNVDIDSIDKLVKTIERCNKPTIQMQILKAHFSNYRYRKTKDESNLWLCFCKLHQIQQQNEEDNYNYFDEL